MHDVLNYGRNSDIKNVNNKVAIAARNIDEILLRYLCGTSKKSAMIISKYIVNSALMASFLYTIPITVNANSILYIKTLKAIDITREKAMVRRLVLL